MKENDDCCDFKVHIIGLPRSGTTAIAEQLAYKLNAPLLNEPIHIWSNGFTQNFPCKKSSTEALKRLWRSERLKKYFGSRFVEKTPYSLFMANNFHKIFDDFRIFIVINRDIGSINRSLYKKVLKNKDPNHGNSIYLLHDLKVKIEKVKNIFLTLGFVSGFIALFRYQYWNKRKTNTIKNLKSKSEIQNHTMLMLKYLRGIRVSKRHHIIEVEYSDFKNNNSKIITELANNVIEITREFKGK